MLTIYCRVQTDTIFEYKFMKAALYFILILGLVFLHPRCALASDTRQGVMLSGSFQKLQKENSQISDDSQSSNSLFDEDLFADDDDDVNVSARKKISVGSAAFTIFSYYSPTTNDLPRNNNFASSYFFHLPPSHFISLKVFRL
jgi:hypothetical protein